MISIGTILEYLHLGEIGFPLELQDIGRFGIGTSILSDDLKAYLKSAEVECLTLKPYFFGFSFSPQALQQISFCSWSN